MDYGLCLPNFRDGASREGMEAAAEIGRAPRLVDRLDDRPHPRRPGGRRRLRPDLRGDPEPRLDRREVRPGPPGHERHRRPVPQRRRSSPRSWRPSTALSGGRVIAGVGVGWSQPEFANLGVADRFHVRARISTRPSACSGICGRVPTEPFHGRFHSVRRLRLRSPPRPGRAACRSSSVVGPRPRSGEPARSGTGISRAPRAPRSTPTACRSSGPPPRPPAGPMPKLVRPRLHRSSGPRPTSSMRSAARPRRWPPRSAPSRRSGVSHLALWFDATDPSEVSALAERFAREVAPLV